jgi:hypothetical protein
MHHGKTRHESKILKNLKGKKLVRLRHKCEVEPVDLYSVTAINFVIS